MTVVVNGGLHERKIFQLPDEKQKRMINAGFRIFSQNSYKISPVSEITDAAGISKSLLFFYFKNKLDLFEAMYREMQAKIEVTEIYPNITAFTIKAFYEKEPEIKALIQADYQRQLSKKQYAALAHINPDKFIPGLDLNLMYQEMYLCAEGYLWEQMQRGTLNAKQMERDFSRMIEFWKSIYLRKSED